VKKTHLALAAFALLAATLFTSGSTRADTWSAGSVVTYDQSDWGDPTNIAGMLLDNKFDSIYASAGGVFEIGSTTPGFFMVFTGAVNLEAFLPTSGFPGPLDANLVNPTASSAGLFAGEAAALKLNLDFSNAGLLPNSSGLLLGNLVLTGFSGSESSLNGLTVNQFFLSVRRHSPGSLRALDSRISTTLRPILTTRLMLASPTRSRKTISSLPARLWGYRSRRRYCSRWWEF